MNPSDAELMAQLQAGDQRAFSALVDRYKDALIGYLTRLTGDQAQAEDLAQEAFLRLHQHADRYSEEGKLSGWLYRIASNLAISSLRRRDRWRWLRAWLAANGNGGQPTPTPEQALQRAQLHRRIGEAIAGLPLRFRIPLVLHELQGLGYQDVAAVTGQPEGTVKSRIHRARALEQLKESSAQQPRMLYLGGTDGVDYVVDLRQLDSGPGPDPLRTSGGSP